MIIKGWVKEMQTNGREGVMRPKVTDNFGMINRKEVKEEQWVITDKGNDKVGLVMNDEPWVGMGVPSKGIGGGG